MNTGNGFTVQGRFPVNVEVDLDWILDACDVMGVMEAAVSQGDGYLGVTGYVYARDSGAALVKLQSAVIIPADKLEVISA